MSHYHEESFGETPAAVVEDAMEQAEVAQAEADAVNQRKILLRIDFLNSGKSIQVLAGETLHNAAAKLDLMIPKSLRYGNLWPLVKC